MSEGQHSFFWRWYGWIIYIELHNYIYKIMITCRLLAFAAFKVIFKSTIKALILSPQAACYSGSFPCPSLAPQPVVLHDAIPTWICCWIWMAEDTTTNTGAKMDERLFPDLSGFSLQSSSCRQCSFGFREDYVASLGMLNEILTILALVQCTQQH